MILPLLILATCVLLIVVYLQFIWPGSWGGSSEMLSWKGASLSLTKGQGYANQGVLTIESLTEQEGQNVAVVSLSPRAFAAKDYASVSWDISGVQPGVQLVFLWHTAENSGRIFARPLVLAKGAVAALDLTGESDWQGQILGVALVVKGQLDAPISIQRVSIKPATARAALTKLLDHWSMADGWQGTSINFLDGDALEQDVSLVVAIAALISLTLALYLVLAKFKLLRAPAAMLWCVVFFGWFVLDARWQWNLFRQLDLTRQQFAGKSADDKHLAADSALFEFMRQVNAALPAAAHIVVSSDDAYLRGKGAYYLYPHNVMSAADSSEFAKCKSGDYLVMFAKKGVRYLASSHTVELDGIQPLPADLLISVAGNYLLKVR